MGPKQKRIVMKAITKKSSSQPGAWIVSPKDKGRKSIRKGNVYLESEEEFMIELFNPLKKCVLCDIRLNGESISESGLMIRPGQREYLDCFIDTRKKFIFKTYNVDMDFESLDAIVDNGSLEIFFYKEDTVTLKDWPEKYRPIIQKEYYPVFPQFPTYPTYPNYPFYGTCVGSTTGGSSDTTLTTTGSIGGQQFTANSSSDAPGLDFSYLNQEMETGRVEKGDKSDQKFNEIEMDFEKNYIHHIIYKLLPESRKPAEVSINGKKHKEVSKKYKSAEISLIEKLADLHKSGVLTDTEFNGKKAELLARI